jgi:hypothetical protein
LIWLFAFKQFHGLVAFLELRCSPWCHAPWLRFSILGLLSGFVLFFLSLCFQSFIRYRC